MMLRAVSPPARARDGSAGRQRFQGRAAESPGQPLARLEERAQSGPTADLLPGSPSHRPGSGCASRTQIRGQREGRPHTRRTAARCEEVAGLAPNTEFTEFPCSCSLPHLALQGKGSLPTRTCPTTSLSLPGSHLGTLPLETGIVDGIKQQGRDQFWVRIVPYKQQLGAGSSTGPARSPCVHSAQHGEGD